VLNDASHSPSSDRVLDGTAVPKLPRERGIPHISFRFESRQNPYELQRCVVGNSSRIGPGTLFAYAITKLAQSSADSFLLIPLNFDRPFFDRPTGTAGGFQVGQQVGEMVPFVPEISDDGHEAAPFPFLDSDASELFARRGTGFRRRRTNAVLVQFVAAFATRRTVKRSPGKQTHFVDTYEKPGSLRI